MYGLGTMITTQEILGQCVTNHLLYSQATGMEEVSRDWNHLDAGLWTPCGILQPVYSAIKFEQM